MKKRLTDRFLQTVRPPANGRDVYIDTEVPGLELRVSSRGVKSWSVRYTPEGKERRRTSYRTYPVVPLAEARARAREIAATAARGIDLPEEDQAGVTAHGGLGWPLLSIEELRALPSVLTGIYFLILEDVIQYIGQSEAIHFRVAQHKSQKIISFDRFVWVECRPSDLDYLEAAYIRKYRPPFNLGRRRKQSPSDVGKG